MKLNRSKVHEAVEKIQPRGKLAKRAARGAIRDIMGAKRLRSITGKATKAETKKS